MTQSAVHFQVFSSIPETSNMPKHQIIHYVDHSFGAEWRSWDGTMTEYLIGTKLTETMILLKRLDFPLKHFRLLETFSQINALSTIIVNYDELKLVARPNMERSFFDAQIKCISRLISLFWFNILLLNRISLANK